MGLFNNFECSRKKDITRHDMTSLHITSHHFLPLFPNQFGNYSSKQFIKPNYKVDKTRDDTKWIYRYCRYIDNTSIQAFWKLYFETNTIVFSYQPECVCLYTEALKIPVILRRFQTKMRAHNHAVSICCYRVTFSSVQWNETMFWASLLSTWSPFLMLK